MKQSQLYVIKNIMYLLFILSIHTAYGSQSEGPIFTTATIRRTLAGLDLICIPAQPIPDFTLLTFKQEQNGHYEDLKVSYQTYEQFIDIGLDSDELDTDNPSITLIPRNKQNTWLFRFSYKPKPEPKRR